MTTPSVYVAKNSEKIIFCTVGPEEKSELTFEIKNEEGTTTRRTISDIERINERLKDLLPGNLKKPPKKRFLLTESKLTERRKNWVETLLNYLAMHLKENAEVQNFFGPLMVEKLDGFVNLGPTERKTIKPNHFDYIKTIGQGSFGKVYMVRYHTDGRIYAMKVLKKGQIKLRNEAKHVMAERNVLLVNVNHPFLVSLHYSFQTMDKLYFVLDFLNGGELFFHLQRERSFPEPRARFYASEIASALGYLHQKSIIYRDLKPENLLLDKFGHVVLTDFGLCKEGIRAKDTTTTFCGTPEYLAPEVILKKPYDATVDWWCLGSVLYEMLFGLPPFYSRNQKEMYERILNQPLSVPNLASNQARDILTGMLKKNRLERLGSKFDFEEIRNHEFFSPIDWERLIKKEIKPPFVPNIRSETDVGNIAKEFVEMEPNPSSLMPDNTFHNRDSEFLGFTYNQCHLQLS